jgi:hypothetical protein
MDTKKKLLCLSRPLVKSRPSPDGSLAAWQANNLFVGSGGSYCVVILNDLDIVAATPVNSSSESPQPISSSSSELESAATGATAEGAVPGGTTFSSNVEVEVGNAFEEVAAAPGL